MRSLNKGWIGITLVILFGISIFFFRGSSRYSNLFNSDNFVANVSGTQISTTQFIRALEMNIGQFSQMIGADLTGEQIRAFQIHQLVLQNLINNAIFENEFDSLNYILDDSTIAKKTKERFPNFYNNNKLNDDALNSFLRQQRLKIEDLVNIIDYETRAVVFDNLLFQKNYPNKFSNKINQVNNQNRLINLLKIPYTNVKIPNLKEKDIKINDEEFLNFFEENSVNYMSQERRDISYIIINKNNYENDFAPNESEIRDYFNNNKELYLIPEQRSFAQFNFKTIEEAENFKLQITGLTKNQILQLSNEENIIFNEFNKVNKNQVLDELANVIFTLNENEVSDIITTTLANHIIILDEIFYEKEATLDEVSEKIKKNLIKVRLDNFFSNLKLGINQQIIDGYSLDNISIENNLEIKKLKDISQNTKNENQTTIAVINYAFTQNKDFISDIYDYDENTSLIVNVDNIYPTEVENIENIFDEVLKDYITSKKLNFVTDVFEENKYKNLDDLNELFKLNIEELNLTPNSDNLSNIFIKDIFSANLEEILISSDQENIYFAKIMEIIIPDNIEESQSLNLTAEIKNAFGNEIIKTKNISVNDELIQGLLSQYK